MTSRAHDVDVGAHDGVDGGVCSFGWV